MMSTQMVRLNITLPFSIAEELNQITVSRKRSQFVAEAIRLRIMQLKDKKLEALLGEGYQAEKEEGLKITKEFEAIDFENWDEY
jgi:metal-responsive CopG/Arc/MetJ family transcriptional regulator